MQDCNAPHGPGHFSLLDSHLGCFVTAHPITEERFVWRNLCHRPAPTERKERRSSEEAGESWSGPGRSAPTSYIEGTQIGWCGRRRC
ncbi:hypothetical protein NDU88_004746 [Pleurodeles waltl]|uniref:Uncharacterized protein n=1 Tax=Pleurodeles waltl TaxID=8319 RepID=A0AAV7T995_PLEWA|nr:hypothetical protein NDU88_004746 [Pleurodeles waltl]